MKSDHYVNIFFSYRTPLMHACQDGSVALVKLLLEYNADTSHKDSKGDMPGFSSFFFLCVCVWPFRGFCNVENTCYTNLIYD